MTDDALATLFHPFEAGHLPPPGAARGWLAFGMPAGLAVPADFAAPLAVAQADRARFLALTAAGFAATPVAEGEGYGGALVHLGRHRAENEAWLAEALARVVPGGTIVAAGHKRDGAASLARRLAALGALEGRLSKHHGVVFWLARPERLDAEALAAWRGPPAKPVDGRFETAPGGFSHDRADAGSRLLAAHLPDDLSGRLADFGAGWGYLSVALAERAGQGARIDLYETHHGALEAARRNMAALAPQAVCRFFWHDLLGEPVTARYDAIVMNPPFHRGRAAEPEIGRAMIRVAAAALAPGGRLLLVANRQLAYEETLARCLAAHGTLAEADGFKVLWGRARG
ncbi:class I SAM-dependent methyltransferase [Aquibium sp. A9E412]|uniref:class I SAM-dependent methyltransferase n=1 Tax=Aquibium sp. A9E412 TaxID=2976767 RepID=UPI0025B22DD9|nr:class I SAM-dependent methyltransferase [Aquibium sp. A9E412]MDN2568029.1 class I SAM-dependent methyltransferase [Aquibium sp. A9E412]